MPTTLSINNFSPANIVEKSQLDATVAKNGVTLALVNNNSIAANDYIVIGTLGAENSELRQVSAVGGSTSVTVPALSFDHARYEPVTKLYGNQITVYRASNSTGLQPADNAFAVFTGSTVAIDIDQGSTPFTDPNGSDSFWYKYVYYNSTTTASTNLADSTAARGQGFGSYCSIDDVRGEAGFKNANYITDTMIDAKRQAAQSEINGALYGFYTVPFAAPVNAFIIDICIRLAAGLLLLEQYGAYDTANTQNGKSKVDMARADLLKLQKGELSLTDTAGAPIAGVGSSGMSGYPNAVSTAIDRADGGTPPMFTVGNRY